MNLIIGLRIYGLLGGLVSSILTEVAMPLFVRDSNVLHSRSVLLCRLTNALGPGLRRARITVSKRQADMV